jgi:hypothetical protein
VPWRLNFYPYLFFFGLKKKKKKFLEKEIEILSGQPQIQIFVSKLENWIKSEKIEKKAQHVIGEVWRKKEGS